MIVSISLVKIFFWLTSPKDGIMTKLIVLLLGSAMPLMLCLDSPAWAHGKPHEGSHLEAVANDCLTVIRKKGTMGVGAWQNDCSSGVHVKWRILSSKKGAGCMPRPSTLLPCLTYVGPHTSTPATTSDNDGRGKIGYAFCKTDGRYSGPWPIASLQDNGSVTFGCYHIGFGTAYEGGK